jgi:ribosome-associated protein
VTDDNDNDDNNGESRRQISRRNQRNAGDQSAQVAHTLMAISDSALGKLELGETLLAAAQRARKIKSMIARRREERALAGALRRVDLDELQKRITSVQSTGVSDTRLLHETERWRAQLIAEGDDAVLAFCAEYPTANAHALFPLIANAKKEQITGRPPGAARALFRHVSGVLKDSVQLAQREQEALEESEPAEE